MGILAMNIVGFAMPFQAYMNPVALRPGRRRRLRLLGGQLHPRRRQDARPLLLPVRGEHAAGRSSRREAKGESPASIHYRRMIWLLVFGLIHLYLIWFGDILVGYALIGMIAFRFRNLSQRRPDPLGGGPADRPAAGLRRTGRRRRLAPASAAAPGADPALVAEWQGLERQFGALGAEAKADEFALYRGGYGGILADRLTDHALAPARGARPVRLGDPGLFPARDGGAEDRLPDRRLERRRSTAGRRCSASGSESRATPCSPGCSPATAFRCRRSSPGRWRRRCRSGR